MEVAKWIIAVVAAANYGGLIADAVVPATSKQHLWNPAWRPHAKLHNVQTMLMGIFGGSLSLAILFGSRVLTFGLFMVAAVAAANYFVAMALATLFPGTSWTDPECVAETARPLGLAPQQLISYMLCSLTGIAVALSLMSTWQF